MMPDLDPLFPLPRRGDRVLVRVHPGNGEAWCRVTGVDDGPDVLFPVTVRLPDGRRGAYQQHELHGWRPPRLQLIRRRA